MALTGVPEIYPLFIIRLHVPEVHLYYSTHPITVNHWLLGTHTYNVVVHCGYMLYTMTLIGVHEMCGRVYPN